MRAPTNASVTVRRQALAYLFLTISSLTWAGNIIVGRYVNDQVPPVALSFWRWAVALAVLLPFTCIVTLQQRDLIVQHWRLLATLGATVIAMFHVFLYQALHFTEAVNAALFLSTTPVIIVALSWILLNDRLKASQGLGIAVSLAGAVVIIMRGEPGRLLQLQLNAGDLWMLAAVPNWALYSVLLRRLPRTFHPMTLVTAVGLFGLAFLVPVYLWEATRGSSFELNLVTVGSILYIGLFASVLAYMCWNRGVALVGANRAGLFMHLIPLFSAVLAVATLGEPVRLFHFVGAALIFAGIYLVTSTPTASVGKQSRSPG
ncbi:MAG: DMT family transporter [Acidiferrobacterales bacterium]